jgi:hypothetical protein
MHILPGSPLRLPLAQHVIGQAETTARKQILAIAIIGASPRFTHQPVDDVTVLDPVLARPTQPRQRFDQTLGVPHLDPLGVQACLRLLADQSAGHRVGVAPDVDRAARVHAHAPALTRLQPPRRQRTQQRQLFLQPLTPARVELLEQPTQERLVGRSVGEVPAARQQERLIQGTLERPVALLHIAVLVGLRRLDGLALQTVVPQQRLVTLGE